MCFLLHWQAGRKQLLLPVMQFFIVLTIFGFIVIFLILCMLYKVKHIVIWNRRPYLIITEEICCLAYLILLNLEFPCGIINSIASVGLSMLILRVSFIHHYLIEDSGSILVHISALFWRNNKLRKHTVLGLLIGILIIRNAVPIIYFSALNEPLQQQFQTPCNRVIVTPVIGFLLCFPVYIVMLIITVFVCDLCHKKAVDKIGMRIELIFITFSGNIFIVISTIIVHVFHFNILWITYINVASLYLWSNAIPFFYVFRHNRKCRKLNIFNHPYNTLQLKSLCRQFFCIENILFILMYQDYLEAPNDALFSKIHSTFLCPDAEYELNIDEHLRLAGHSPEGLDDIYLECMQLINNNVLPYMQNDEA